MCDASITRGRPWNRGCSLQGSRRAVWPDTLPAIFPSAAFSAPQDRRRTPVDIGAPRTTGAVGSDFMTAERFGSGSIRRALYKRFNQHWLVWDDIGAVRKG